MFRAAEVFLTVGLFTILIAASVFTEINFDIEQGLREE